MIAGDNILKKEFALIGNLSGKYRGKIIPDQVNAYTQLFSIQVYEAQIHHATITDARQVGLLTGEEQGQPVYLNCPVHVFTRGPQDARIFKIHPGTITIFQPLLENVVQRGAEVFGEISGFISYPVGEKQMQFNPVQIPEIRLQPDLKSAVEFKKIEIPPPPPPKTSMLKTFREIGEGIGYLIALGVIWILAFQVFSLFHPYVLLGGLGLLGLWAIQLILPQNIRLPIHRFFDRTGNWLIRSAGFILVLVLAFTYVRNLNVILLVILPGLCLVFAMDYLSDRALELGHLLTIACLLIFFLSIPVKYSNTSTVGSASGWTGSETTQSGDDGPENPGVTSRQADGVSPEKNNSSPPYRPIPKIQKPAGAEKAVIETEAQEDSSYVTKRITWTGFDSIKYTISYRIYEKDYRESRQSRMLQNVQLVDYPAYSSLFQEILAGEPPRIHSIVSGLDSLRSSYCLNQMDFAEVLVAMVQQLEYTLLFPGDCPQIELPCLAGIENGIYSPTEFLYNLKGDCDTKSLFLYQLFDAFEYHVALIGSLEYEHAMIALQLPYSGTAISGNGGLPYYVWETTAPGWLPGEMPEETNLLPFWKVILNNQKNSPI